MHDPLKAQQARAGAPAERARPGAWRPGKQLSTLWHLDAAWGWLLWSEHAGMTSRAPGVTCRHGAQPPPVRPHQHRVAGCLVAAGLASVMLTLASVAPSVTRVAS